MLTVDQESEKFTLGIKQLTEDPWTNVPTAYPVGGLVKGIITNITDFGLFVEVEEGIEGLVHVSELSNKKVKTPAELYKEGEEIQAKIIHVSAEDRRLGLSIKQLKDEEERKKPREYSRSGPEADQSLGDLLKPGASWCRASSFPGKTPESVLCVSLQNRCAPDLPSRESAWGRKRCPRPSLRSLP